MSDRPILKFSFSNEEPGTENLQDSSKLPSLSFQAETSQPDLDATGETSEDEEHYMDKDRKYTLKYVPVDNLHTEDITPDKSEKVRKVNYKIGVDDVPRNGVTVVFHYDAFLTYGAKKVPLEMDQISEATIGAGEVIKGLDLALSTMKKEEASIFYIQPEYGYGAEGSPPKVPPNASLLYDIKMFRWLPEDLSQAKDGSIMREVLENGSGNIFPNEGSEVKVKYLGHYKNKVFEQCEKEFILGEGCYNNVPEGIEMALYKFYLKEKSLIHLKGKYGIPLKSSVTYEVTLLSFERVKDVWEMNTDEKYEKAKLSKEKGIVFTKAKNYKGALKNFKWIVTCLENEPGVEPESVQPRKDLLLSGYLNISLCLSKLDNYKDTIKFCDKALEMQPGNEKALFRRGQAKMLINDCEEALEDFNAVCKLYPDNKAAKRHVLSCQERIIEQKAKDKKVYSKMFEKFVKQDQAQMRNMKTETGVWQEENAGGEENDYMNETERMIEENISLLGDGQFKLIEFSNSVRANYPE